MVKSHKIRLAYWKNHCKIRVCSITQKTGERHKRLAEDVNDCSIHCTACCMVGKKSGGQGRSFWRVPDTYSQTETNSNGKVKQQCADCASNSECCQKAGPKKARIR